MKKTSPYIHTPIAKVGTKLLSEEIASFVAETGNFLLIISVSAYTIDTKRVRIYSFSVMYYKSTN